MLRFLAPLCALLLCVPAHADSYITRLLNKPVPGGVAVIDLGAGAQAPKATYEGKPVLVVKEQGTRWLAIVGVPLTVKPGSQQLVTKDASGSRKLDFVVGSKKYPEQRITLKNQRQVNPNPDDLKRIEGELAEQLKAYRSFSPSTPSNLALDKPVAGPLSSKFGVRRFFNGEERNPHSGLDFAVPAGTPIKAPAATNPNPYGLKALWEQGDWVARVTLLILASFIIYEAIRRLVVEDFPVVVVNDLYGGDLYREGRERWRRFRK